LPQHRWLKLQYSGAVVSAAEVVVAGSCPLHDLLLTTHAVLLPPVILLLSCHKNNK
jgi:hypothetical protein